MNFADLHLHTIFSDGTYTPEELISECRKNGISCAGIVDHDTVCGIQPVLNAAKDSGIEVLPGIEVSCEHNGLEIHILGYLINPENRALLERLRQLKENRIERVHKIIGKLKDIGIALDPQDVFAIAKQATVGRLHIARAMLKKGVVSSIFEAFHKYIGDRGPAFVLGFKFSVSEAIKLVIDSGGIPVLAHPYSINNDDLIPEFITCGLMGLEVYYPEHTQSMINFYLGLTKKYNLLATGGSDCHGSAKPEVRIGSIKIPYELVERLKEKKKKSD